MQPLAGRIAERPNFVADAAGLTNDRDELRYSNPIIPESGKLL